MTLTVCYNDNCKKFVEQLNQVIPQISSEIEIITYNEDDYKERKKSYKVKGGYSARMNPFVLILGDEKQYLKAFYSEDKGCTVDNISAFFKD